MGGYRNTDGKNGGLVGIVNFGMFCGVKISE
jgi:hypothetical protein